MWMEDYKYLRIQDVLECLNQNVSFFGVVFEIGLPKRTSYCSECYCTLKIVDDSHSNCGIPVVFEGNIEMLPHVASLGDIIQLSHVKIKMNYGKLYAQFNMRLSAFALYNKQGDGNAHPYHTSRNFNKNYLDRKHIIRLRNWPVDVLQEEGIKVQDSDTFMSLRGIKEGESANLECKVLHVFETVKDDWMALVWDGTDCASCKLKSKVGEETDSEATLQSMLPRHLLSTFPTVGSIVRVRIGKVNKKYLLRLVKAGKWARFLNLRFEEEAGLPILRVQRSDAGQFSTLLQFVPDHNSLESACDRLYRERLSSKLGRIPHGSLQSGFRMVLGVEYENAPFATLMDALTYPEIVGKFKCVVRVVACLPWRVEDFRCRAGKYRVRFTLEDPTARIHAFLYGEDGDKFFNGDGRCEEVKKMRNTLMGMEEDEVESPGRPPWVQVCLFSYHLNDEDAWGSRHFRIFATKFLPFHSEIAS